MDFGLKKVRKFSVNKRFTNDVPVTRRVTTVLRMFGVTSDRIRDAQTTHAVDLEINDGDIVYITGPSGAGKSVLLREMQNEIPADERISIDDIDLPADRAAVDCVGFTAETAENAEEKNNKKQISAVSACSAVSLTTVEAIRLLSYAGLSDVFCMLTAPANLSEGQKYRYRLAVCLASGKKYVFADEFCSQLDRITAACLAYNVRRFAKQKGVTFVLASSHEDVLADLQPDVLVVKHFEGPAEVVYKKKF